MLLSTAQSIPVDIYVLILDYLPVKDLHALHRAYPDIGQIAQIAHWRSMLRLCSLITKGETHIKAIIDGDRLYYKRYRSEPFRQVRLNGRAAPAMPFVPFDSQAKFDREFVGTNSAPQIVLSPTPDQRYHSLYAPIDRSGAPGEVVTVEVSFTMDDEIVSIEYDTRDVLIENPIFEEYHEDGVHLNRIVSHRIPLVKATWRGIDDKEGHDLPTDWFELLGFQCFVKVVFTERLPDRPTLVWTGTATMQSFELGWDIKLDERCCTSDVLNIWRQKPPSGI
jgi:hypothetical protein